MSKKSRTLNCFIPIQVSGGLKIEVSRRLFLMQRASHCRSTRRFQLISHPGSVFLDSCTAEQLSQEWTGLLLRHCIQISLEWLHVVPPRCTHANIDIPLFWILAAAMHTYYIGLDITTIEKNISNTNTVEPALLHQDPQSRLAPPTHRKNIPFTISANAEYSIKVNRTQCSQQINSRPTA